VYDIGLANPVSARGAFGTADNVLAFDKRRKGFGGSLAEAGTQTIIY
jgi:hypothetical protein